MYRSIQKQLPSVSTISIRPISSKQKLKDYVFPEIKNEDIDHSFIAGWGPGGSKVNKSINCARLKHMPTGVQVKVFETRSAEKNLAIAYERLKLAVDKHLNGPNCYEEQLKKLEEKKADSRKDRRKSRKLKREEWKQEALEMEERRKANKDENKSEDLDF